MEKELRAAAIGGPGAAHSPSLGSGGPKGGGRGVDTLPSETHKTKMCHDFLAGKCFKGEFCAHAHNPAELRQKGEALMEAHGRLEQRGSHKKRQRTGALVVPQAGHSPGSGGHQSSRAAASGGSPRHGQVGQQHPQARDPYYKTQMCPFGNACAGQCGGFFAHSQAEKRPVPAPSPVDSLVMGPAFPMMMAPMMPGMGMPVMPPMMPGIPLPLFSDEERTRRKEEKKHRKEKEKEKDRRREKEKEKAAKEASRQRVVLKPGKRDQVALEKPTKKERRVDDEDL